MLTSVISLGVSSAQGAQDVLTIGSGSATSGPSAQVPVYLRDVSSTALGTDATSRIQGIALKVTFSPASAVASAGFVRAGVLAPLTPIYESILPSASGIAYVGLFSATTDPIPLTLDAAPPGDRIGTLTITFDSSAPAGSPVDLTIESATAALSNQTGTTGETVANGQLALVSGTATPAKAVTSTLLQSSSNPSTSGQTVTFTATVTSGTAGTMTGAVDFYDGGTLIGSGSVASGQATFSTATLTAGTHSMTAFYEGDTAFLPSTSPAVSQVVNAAAFGAPTGVLATATSTTAVGVTWYPVTGADHYEIWRSFNHQPFALLGVAASPPYTDGSLVPDTTYLYEVRAVNGSGNPSAYSAIDAATTIMFTDDPLVAGSTPVKAVHVTELRTAVNAFRAAAGLAAYAFTDAIAPDVVIRAIDVSELRTALDQARAALSMPAISYADPTLLGGTTYVKRIHFQALRGWVQ